jgi:hypothetical protein
MADCMPLREWLPALAAGGALQREPAIVRIVAGRGARLGAARSRGLHAGRRGCTRAPSAAVSSNGRRWRQRALLDRRRRRALQRLCSAPTSGSAAAAS